MSRSLRRLALWLPSLAVAAVMVALNLWTLLDPVRFDLTSGRVFTITPETQRVLDAMRKPVRITYFYDLRSKAQLDAKALLEQYAARSDLIEVQFYDPLLQPAVARRYQVSFPGTGIFESDGRRIAVSGLNEVEFTNGLIRVTQDAAQKVCFTEGHLESDPFSLKSHDHIEGGAGLGHSHSDGGRPLEVHERHGMGMARDALAALGYDVAKVLLAGGPGQLRGCSVVVVASPQRAFLPREAAELVAYLEAGGRAVLMLEPFVSEGLEPVLDLFGIVAAGHPVIDETRHYWTDARTPAVTDYPRHKVTRNVALTFFPGVESFSPRPGGIPNDVRVTPLAETSPDARLDTADEDAGPRPRPLVVEAVKRLGDDREARVLVFGDGDFATNSFFAILGNEALFLNAVSYLAEREELIDIQPRNYELPRIRLTNTQMQFTFAVSTFLLPGLLLVAGFAVWRLRR